MKEKCWVVTKINISITEFIKKKFNNMYKWNKFIVINAISIESLRTLKYHTLSVTLFSIICRKYGCNNNMLFEKEESIKVLTILCSNSNINK